MDYVTYDNFWNIEMSKVIKQNHGQMDLIFSANTVSHVQNLNEFLIAVKHTLTDDGVFVVECPSLLHLLKGNAFDQFYHEHHSYFSSVSFYNILKRNGLRLFDIELHPVHGGSYRFFICKDSCRSINIDHGNVNYHIYKERKFGLHKYNVLKKCMNTMKQNMLDIKATLENLKYDGKTVIGYGATAKFTQVSNMCGLNSNLIKCVVDTTPDKQNKYIPKSNIEIVSHDSVTTHDYYFLGAWNYKNEILKKEKHFINAGGKFITHIPKVEIIS